MNMKKNSKSKVNNPFADVVAVVLCVAFFLFSNYCLVKNLNSSFGKNTSNPIGTITFKYKTAQRKLSDTMTWDRLQNNSPVYDGDMIRTADLSQATIHFPNGEVLELEENTLIQASKPRFGKERMKIKFEFGSMSFKTDTAQSNSSQLKKLKPIVIQKGETIIYLEENSEIKINAEPKTDCMFLEMFKGSAVVEVYENGKVDDISEVTAGQNITVKAISSDVEEKNSIEEVALAQIVNTVFEEDSAAVVNESEIETHIETEQPMEIGTEISSETEIAQIEIDSEQQISEIITSNNAVTQKTAPQKTEPVKDSPKPETSEGVKVTEEKEKAEFVSLSQTSSASQKADVEETEEQEDTESGGEIAKTEEGKGESVLNSQQLGLASNVIRNDYSSAGIWKSESSGGNVTAQGVKFTKEIYEGLKFSGNFNYNVPLNDLPESVFESSKFSFKAIGDGNSYKINFRTTKGVYTATFQTTKNTVLTIEFPFTALKPESDKNSAKFNLDDVAKLGFSAVNGGQLTVFDISSE